MEREVEKFEPKFCVNNVSIDNQYKELIEGMNYAPLQKFIDDLLCENKVSVDDLSNSISIANLAKFILLNERMTNKHATTSIELVIVAASFLHNLYYSYGDKEISKLFLFREKHMTDDLEPEVIQFFDMICQAIEGQLGKDTPIAQLIPISGNPTYYFALACSLYYKNQLGREISW